MQKKYSYYLGLYFVVCTQIPSYTTHWVSVSHSKKTRASKIDLLLYNTLSSPKPFLHSFFLSLLLSKALRAHHTRPDSFTFGFDAFHIYHLVTKPNPSIISQTKTLKGSTSYRSAMGDFNDAFMRNPQNAAVQGRTKVQNRANVQQLKLVRYLFHDSSFFACEILRVFVVLS